MKSIGRRCEWRGLVCAAVLFQCVSWAQAQALPPGSSYEQLLQQQQQQQQQPGAHGGMSPDPRTGVPRITNVPSHGQGAGESQGLQRRDPRDARGQGLRPGGEPHILDPFAPRSDVLPPPERDSEFQRFVFDATGERLPRFGQRLFDVASTTFAPVDRVPVPADYVLGPGDELYIRGWGAVDIDYRALIDRNGLINLPRVGSVRVAGLKAGEVEGFLEKQVARVFRNFSLNVTLGQLRSIQIFIVGQAQRPGSYTVGSLSTLVNAVFASGGPSSTGSMRRIQLRREGQVVTELDLYDFVIGGDKSRDVPLLPGDVIVYAPVGPQVALRGATDNAAIYELRAADEPLKQLLAYAGGLAPVTDRHRVHIERIDAGRAGAPRTVEALALDEAGLARGLRNGDIITLFDIEPQFANAVTLRGNVARPLRYPHVSGMRVSDLIPDREALITPDYFRRKNRLVQYLDAPRFDENGSRTLRPTLPGESRPFSPGQPPNPGTQGYDRSFDMEAYLDRLPTETTRRLVDEPNWEYAVIERLNPDNLTIRIISFHLGRAVIDRHPEDNLELLPGDVVTIYGRNDLRAPQATTTRVVRVEGEVQRPGVYQLAPGETLRSVLVRAGGVTPQAYVFGMEFSRQSTRQKQREAIQDAVRRLEAGLASASAEQIANLSSTDAAAAARLQTAQDEARRALLQRLRSLEPNGRIALELDPKATSAITDLPDIPLEDGDRVLVPTRPGFVFAVGAVANTNAIVWRSGRTLSDYLRVAGVEPSADDDNIFVVRADGSVVHTRDSRGVFARSIGSLELAAGDTIVVPERLNRETRWTAFVRGLKDWTQILYQFGLTAAAIHTLRQ